MILVRASSASESKGQLLRCKTLMMDAESEKIWQVFPWYICRRRSVTQIIAPISAKEVSWATFIASNMHAMVPCCILHHLQYCLSNSHLPTHERKRSRAFESESRILYTDSHHVLIGVRIKLSSCVLLKWLQWLKISSPQRSPSSFFSTSSIINEHRRPYESP